jgi:hypothetical protein
MRELFIVGRDCRHSEGSQRPGRACARQDEYGAVRQGVFSAAEELSYNRNLPLEMELDTSAVVLAIN